MPHFFGKSIKIGVTLSMKTKLETEKDNKT